LSERLTTPAEQVLDADAVGAALARASGPLLLVTGAGR
jgi:hypothetical protein